MPPSHPHRSRYLRESERELSCALCIPPTVTFCRATRHPARSTRLRGKIACQTAPHHTTPSNAYSPTYPSHSLSLSPTENDTTPNILTSHHTTNITLSTSPQTCPPRNTYAHHRPPEYTPHTSQLRQRRRTVLHNDVPTGARPHILGGNFPSVEQSRLSPLHLLQKGYQITTKVAASPTKRPARECARSRAVGGSAGARGLPCKVVPGAQRQYCYGRSVVEARAVEEREYPANGAVAAAHEHAEAPDGAE